MFVGLGQQARVSTRRQQEVPIVGPGGSAEGQNTNLMKTVRCADEIPDRN